MALTQQETDSRILLSQTEMVVVDVTTLKKAVKNEDTGESPARSLGKVNRVKEISRKD